MQNRGFFVKVLASLLLAVLWCFPCLARVQTTDSGFRGETLRRKSSQSAQRRTKSDVAIAPRIVGGTDAIDNRYAYAQISMRDSNGNHQCGGTLIASDVILTAGHCQGYFDSIHIGRHDLNDPLDEFEELVHIEDRRHFWYQATKFRYDFSVVKLERPVLNTTLVRLNADPNLLLEGDSLVVVGYGASGVRQETPKFIFPDVFQVGNVKYLSNPACRETTVQGQQLYENDIYSEMMCAANPGVDACAGDSGSALILPGATPADDIQVGVVSWGRGCAIYPGVYGRTSKVYEWIRFHTCELATDPPAYLDCLNTGGETSSETPTQSPVAAADGRTQGTDGLPSVTSSTHLPSLGLVGVVGWLGLFGLLV